MKIVGKIFASIYSILFVFISLCFLSLFFTRTFISRDFLVSSLKKIDLEAIKVEDLGTNDYFADYDENITLSEAITNEMEKAGIDKEKAEEIVNDEKLREFIGDKANEVIEAIANEEEIKVVTNDEVKDALGVLELTEDNYQEVTDFLNEVISEVNKEVQNARGL